MIRPGISLREVIGDIPMKIYALTFAVCFAVGHVIGAWLP